VPEKINEYENTGLVIKFLWSL